MRKISDGLRLRAAGSSVCEIARSTGAERTTVYEYLLRADAAGSPGPCPKAWVTTRSMRCCSRRSRPRPSAGPCLTGAMCNTRTGRAHACPSG